MQKRDVAEYIPRHVDATVCLLINTTGIGVSEPRGLSSCGSEYTPLPPPTERGTPREAAAVTKDSPPPRGGREPTLQRGISRRVAVGGCADREDDGRED
jgi:hypothetical protein